MSQRRPDPGAQTRKRILDTAERLFGERGVAAVSLRDINRAAKISQGVLHYHFGGRDALLEAILQRGLPALNAGRRQMVEQLRASGKTPDVRDVVALLGLPLARLLTSKRPADRRFLRCLARLNQEHNEVWARVSAQHIDGVPVFEMLRDCMPAATRPMLEWHLGMIMNALHATLSDIGRPGHAWQAALNEEPLAAEAQVQALIEFICVGISGIAAGYQQGASAGKP
jgi:AcrR family transcriptional regulator